MTDADVVARYMEKYPNLKGCFAVNADAVLLAMDAFETAENEEDIVLMGFDAGKEQIAALKNGTMVLLCKIRSAWDMRQLWRRRGLRLRSEMRQPSIQDMFGWIKKIWTTRT